MKLSKPFFRFFSQTVINMIYTYFVYIYIQYRFLQLRVRFTFFEEAILYIQNTYKLCIVYTKTNGAV